MICSYIILMGFLREFVVKISKCDNYGLVWWKVCWDNWVNLYWYGYILYYLVSCFIFFMLFMREIFLVLKLFSLIVRVFNW